MMKTVMASFKTTVSFRITAAVILMVFSCVSVLPNASAQMVSLPMPVPGSMVNPSSGFVPAKLTGIQVFPENPLLMNFLVDQGDQILLDDEKQDEYKRLIKYFLGALTTPEEDMWVNLSPYEEDKMIPQGFDQTELGRDLLAQDYLLKQLTASLAYPEGELGQRFWNRIYEESYSKFGTTEVKLDGFNKVWIVPDRAEVFEEGTRAFIGETKLKVLMEEDYAGLAKERRNTQIMSLPDSSGQDKDLRALNTRVMNEIIIPEIEREVNEGESFAPLRQVYHGMVLAAWFKRRLKESILNKVYVDQSKTDGVSYETLDNRQKTADGLESNVSRLMSVDDIYQDYLEAFKKGAVNYIKEDYDPYAQEVIPRKYFSGGWASDKIGQVLDFQPVSNMPSTSRNYDEVLTKLNPESDDAMRIEQFPVAPTLLFNNIINRAMLDGRSRSVFDNAQSVKQRMAFTSVALFGALLIVFGGGIEDLEMLEKDTYLEGGFFQEQRPESVLFNMGVVDKGEDGRNIYGAKFRAPFDINLEKISEQKGVSLELLEYIFSTKKLIKKDEVLDVRFTEEMGRYLLGRFLQDAVDSNINGHLDRAMFVGVAEKMPNEDQLVRELFRGIADSLKEKDRPEIKRFENFSINSPEVSASLTIEPGIIGIYNAKFKVDKQYQSELRRRLDLAKFLPENVIETAQDEIVVRIQSVQEARIFRNVIENIVRKDRLEGLALSDAESRQQNGLTEFAEFISSIEKDFDSAQLSYMPSALNLQTDAAMKTAIEQQLEALTPEQLEYTPELMQLLSAVFASREGINSHIKFDFDVLSALGYEWDPEKRKEFLERIQTPMLVYQVLLSVLAYNRASVENFEKSNPSTYSIVNQLPRATHQAWLSGERGKATYVAYTARLHGLLIDLIDQGVLDIDRDLFLNPNKKHKIKPEDLNWDDTPEDRRKELQDRLDNLVGGKENYIINTVAGEWDELASISTWKGTQADRLAYLRALQKDSEGAVLGALLDKSFIGRLASVDSNERMQAVVEVLARVNVGWREGNPWLGIENSLLGSPFANLDQGGIGVVEIVKDARVVKAILEALHQAVLENRVNLDKDVANNIELAFRNGLGSTLEASTQESTLEEAINNRPQQPLMSFQDLKQLVIEQTLFKIKQDRKVAQKQNRPREIKPIIKGTIEEVSARIASEVQGELQNGELRVLHDDQLHAARTRVIQFLLLRADVKIEEYGLVGKIDAEDVLIYFDYKDSGESEIFDKNLWFSSYNVELRKDISHRESRRKPFAKFSLINAEAYHFDGLNVRNAFGVNHFVRFDVSPIGPSVAEQEKELLVKAVAERGVTIDGQKVKLEIVRENGVSIGVRYALTDRNFNTRNGIARLAQEFNKLVYFSDTDSDRHLKEELFVESIVDRMEALELELLEQNDSAMAVYQNLKAKQFNLKGMVEAALDVTEPNTHNALLNLLKGSYGEKQVEEQIKALRGGIDFNRNFLDLAVTADGSPISFTPEQFKYLENLEFSGFDPVILEINTGDVSTLPIFQGLPIAPLSKDDDADQNEVDGLYALRLKAILNT